MKLLHSILFGSALSFSPDERFPRTPSSVCKVDLVQGRSCADVAGNPESGIYMIQPGREPVVVECIFERGQAFTVIQKRTTGKLSFNRGWDEYKRGFTSWNTIKNSDRVSGRGPRPDALQCTLEEYWIGLDNIYALTNGMTQNNLRIDLERYNGQVGTVSYDNFIIADESDSYRLNSLGQFLNDPTYNLGNAFIGSGFQQDGYSPRDKYNTNHLGMAFSTSDNDNDKYWGNCGLQDSSGWWFNRCSAANLNGKHYGQGSSALFNENEYGFDDGILWHTWTSNKFESLVGSKMMVSAFQADEPEDQKRLPAKSCQEVAVELYNSGQFSTSSKDGSLDGVYQINGAAHNTVDVQCKFSFCGGRPTGWTLIQNRYDGSVDFNRNWQEYKNGFGFENGNEFRGPRPSAGLGEGWLGNDLIHELTESVDPNGVSLFIEMERRFEQHPNNGMVGYERFAIGNEYENYVLKHIDGFTDLSGNAGNAFLGDDFGKQGFGNDQADTNHKGMMFSTKDRDNDNIKEFHCGAEDVSGWWFNACSAANLNGHYYSQGFVDGHGSGRKPARGVKEFDDGILWNTWTHDKWESLMTTRMWISAPGNMRMCMNEPAFRPAGNDAISTDYESSSSSFDYRTDNY